MDLLRNKTSKIRYSEIYNWFFLILPFIQFFEFYYFKEFIVSDDLTLRRIGFPILSTIFLPFILLSLLNFFKTSYFNIFILLYTLLLLLITADGINFKLAFIVHLLYLLAMITSENNKKIYFYYLIGYTAVSLIVFILRYNSGIQIYLLRSSINIWGGISLVGAWLIYYFLEDNRKYKQYIILVSLFISTIYISRTSLIVIGFIYILNYLRLSLKNIILYLIVYLILIYVTIDYTDFIISRLSVIDENTLAKSRTHIWSDSINIINETNYLGTGFGNYILYSYSNYSNAHNFFLGLLTELSLFAFPYIVMSLKPCYLYFKSKQFNRMITYVLFLIFLIFGGIPLWQVGGTISLTLFLGFLLLNEKVSFGKR